MTTSIEIDNKKITSINDFKEFALKVNGEYVKLYVTSSMQTVHFLRDSGALVLYYGYAESKDENDHIIYSKDGNIFQLYLGERLLLSGNGFNEDVREKLFQICTKYDNDIAEIYKTLETKEEVALKLDRKSKSDSIEDKKNANINDTNVDVFSTNYRTKDFLEQLMTLINQLNDNLVKVNVQNKNIALNYKLKSITILYTRCIYHYNTGNSGTIISGYDSSNTPNKLVETLNVSGNEGYLKNIIPVETYEYKLGEKNYLPSGSRIISINFEIELYNVYQKEAEQIALISDANYKQYDYSVNSIVTKENEKAVVYTTVGGGGELIKVTTISFNIDYRQPRENNESSQVNYIGHNDGYIIENGKNVVFNRLFYVENIKDSDTEDSILSQIDWSEIYIDSSDNLNTFYNIYTLVNEQIIIYGNEEIYYNYCSDNIIRNDIYNYVCSEHFDYLHDKNNVQFKPIYEIEDYKTIKLPLHYYKNIISVNTNTQIDEYITNVNQSLKYTPIQFVYDNGKNTLSININKLVICIPNKYVINDVQLIVGNKYYNISTHTKLVHQINDMPKYFSLPQDHSVGIENDTLLWAIDYQYSNEYKIYSINNISVVCLDFNYLEIDYFTKLSTISNLNINDYLSLIVTYNLDNSNTITNNTSNIDFNYGSQNKNKILNAIIAPVHNYNGEEGGSTLSKINSYYSNLPNIRSIFDKNTIFDATNSITDETVSENISAMSIFGDDLFKDTEKNLITEKTVINDNISKYWITPTSYDGVTDNINNIKSILSNIL